MEVCSGSTISISRGCSLNTTGWLQQKSLLVTTKLVTLEKKFQRGILFEDWLKLINVTPFSILWKATFVVSFHYIQFLKIYLVFFLLIFFFCLKSAFGITPWPSLESIKFVCNYIFKLKIRFRPLNILQRRKSVQLGRKNYLHDSSEQTKGIQILTLRISVPFPSVEVEMISQIPVCKYSKDILLQPTRDKNHLVPKSVLFLPALSVRMRRS